LSNCVKIKVEEVGYYPGYGETFIYNYVSRRGEEVPDKCFTREDI